jgi:hypothetical protein
MAIDFREQLKYLRQLQDIDLDLHKSQTELDSLPGRIAVEKAAFDAVSAEFFSVKAELEALEAAKKEDERCVQEAVEHLRERETKLYAIKTNKEYQAAIKEISEGKRLNREREDRILQAMEKIEKLSQKSAQLDLEFADKKKVFEQKQLEVERELGEISARMAQEAQNRPEVVLKIEKTLLRKYDFIRKHYALAVANVVGGACEGCMRRVPPQMLNEMLKFDDCKLCPNCQRMIYLDVKKTIDSADPLETEATLEE